MNRRPDSQSKRNSIWVCSPRRLHCVAESFAQEVVLGVGFDRQELAPVFPLHHFFQSLLVQQLASACHFSRFLINHFFLLTAGTQTHSNSKSPGTSAPAIFRQLRS